VPVYTLPGVPPTTEAFIEAVSNADVDWALVAPVLIDELGKNPDLLEAVAPHLKHIFFAGGGAAKRSGDVVAEKLSLRQVLGSSEAGIVPLMDAENLDPKDWNYMAFNPAHRFEMRNQHDDLYELVFVRDERPEGAQAVFSMFPDMQEYHTKDLFRPHPFKEGFWLFNNRLDDVIVFLNGEKTNPLTFEAEVAHHPEVRAALVLGSQRVEAAILIELATNKLLSNEENTAVINRIWPVIEKANKATPAHARVAKSKILLVNPEKPMLRAGKGTVQRNATLKVYAAEIDELYQREDVTESSYANGTGEKDIKTIIRNVVAEMVDLDDLDLFQLGMDSLGVLKVRRALQRLFPSAKLSNNTVYTNSSVNALAQAMQKLTAPTNGENTTNGDHSNDELATMLDEYSREIDAIKPVPYVNGHTVIDERKLIIMLTGSTGALGSYIFERLLSRADIAHIYCFNRTADARDRQVDNNRTRKLTTNFPSERVTFLTGDLAKPNFGLPENDYQALHENVTHIIHNAWPVNFNLPLSSFRSSVSGVIDLIRFSAQSKQKSEIQFLSSISSVSSYPGNPVPEAVLNDLSTPSPMGYGQSKYLSERLLDHACKTLDIRASFVRLGQIAGAARTASGWNKQEWLPSLVASSAFTGVLPETIGDMPKSGEEVINWVPADHLADVLVELALDTTHGKGKVSANHVVHPNPVLWSSLLEPIRKAIQESTSSSQPIKVVSYSDWLSTLKIKTAEAESEAGLDHAQLAQRNPAMKLLEFYEGLATSGEGALRQNLALEETMKGSKTLRELEPLRDEWVTGWVKEWVRLSGQASKPL
jgi:thioester reductase-like protein